VIDTARIPTTGPPSLPSGLEAQHLRVAYGGNVAVSDASLNVPLGRITGLIGPNGAGKTTMFNACNGLVRLSAGTLHLFGRDVTRLGTAARARLGLGRTFQLVEICQTMTVRTNVALGAEARQVGRNPLRQFRAGRSERQAIVDSTDEALKICGISALANRGASTLSTGQRRLLELARVLAGGFRLLLLDEPSSGLDEEETARFGAILTSIVRLRGIGVLLVEHDMSLVMEVCNYIYVLDFGQLIFEGTPAETQSSDAVRAAYLGDESVPESQRS
jgi:ABC-type branched-subunit amino acid transport system ATPase component